MPQYCDATTFSLYCWIRFRSNFCKFLFLMRKIKIWNSHHSLCGCVYVWCNTMCTCPSQALHRDSRSPLSTYWYWGMRLPCGRCTFCFAIETRIASKNWRHTKLTGLQTQTSMKCFTPIILTPIHVGLWSFVWYTSIQTQSSQIFWRRMIFCLSYPTLRLLVCSLDITLGVF